MVLFDGGINLRLPDDGTRQAVLRIVLVRLVLALAAGLLAAHWLAGLNWSLAAVFSAIVLATGPTVVTPLVRQIRLASPLGWGGVACVLVLMLVVRPVAVGLATWGLDFSLPQRALLAWLAPRGIVTAAVASLFAIRLEQAGVVGAGRLQGLVFLTILLTVGLQGLSAGPLARRLGLEAAADPSPVGAAAVQQQPGGQ